MDTCFCGVLLHPDTRKTRWDKELAPNRTKKQAVTCLRIRLSQKGLRTPAVAEGGRGCRALNPVQQKFNCVSFAKNIYELASHLTPIPAFC